jgi:hypothetical protein
MLQLEPVCQQGLLLVSYLQMPGLNSQVLRRGLQQIEARVSGRLPLLQAACRTFSPAWFRPAVVEPTCIPAQSVLSITAAQARLAASSTTATLLVRPPAVAYRSASKVLSRTDPPFACRLPLRVTPSLHGSWRSASASGRLPPRCGRLVRGFCIAGGCCLPCGLPVQLT